VPKKIKAIETDGPDRPVESSTAIKMDKSPKRRPLAGRPPAKKTAAKRTKAPGKSRQPKSTGEPSDEQIRTRAYFIAERRHRLGLPGDASSDWLEAKKQLLSELGPR
jgi:hypothetical protein